MTPSELLYKREIGQKFSVTHLLDTTVTQVPTILKEYPVDIVGRDKVFSSYWLNDNDILFGTKDEMLHVYNLNHSKLFDIPLVKPPNFPIPKAHKDSITDLRGGHRAQNICYGYGLLSKDFTSLAGIRAIAGNPCGTLIAVACCNPYSIHILDLPSLSTNTILQGHTDAIFSMAWIDNTTIISGSRDGTMKCWKLDRYRNRVQSMQDVTNRPIEILEPSWSEVEAENHRIRDLTYIDMKAVTLSTNGKLGLWDLDKQTTIKAICLPFPLEAVCMTGNEQNTTVAIGSQAHVSILDIRCGSFVHTFQSINEYTGVRSVDFYEYIITSGGGMGHIGWYDLRAQDYLKMDGQDFRCASTGWFETENDLQGDSEAWRGNSISAVYTLKYNRQRTKLFTAGGPLEANIKGANAGVWM
ncbi:WD40-repeat-containing domain protein [Umbelopsis sp. PMI_123]|nr:WD40-repeat-containing domain protein [Umbelopsis sp. PMI_123]